MQSERDRERGKKEQNPTDREYSLLMPEKNVTTILLF